jgi:hypothetical protein
MSVPSPIHHGNRLDDFVWLDLRALRCNRNEELRGRIRAEFTQHLSRRLLEFPLAFRCHRQIHNRFPILGDSTRSTKGRSPTLPSDSVPHPVSCRLRYGNHSSTGEPPAVSRAPQITSGRPISRQGGTYFGPNLTIHLRARPKTGDTR